MSDGKYICTVCGTVGDPKRVTKGSFLIEVVLWFWLIIPGLIYTIWRNVTKYDACPECKNPSMIPNTSPAGQKLLAERIRAATPKKSETELKPTPGPHLRKETDDVRRLASNYLHKMESNKN